MLVTHSRLRSRADSCARQPALREPSGIRALRFHVGSDEFALLSCDLPPKESVPIRGLSPSERSVAELVLQGHSNAEVARARSTSTRTVANQIAAVFRKLEVKSRRELRALVLREPKEGA
jgi:DNA-binding CsgD family transcriptional regulator